MKDVNFLKGSIFKSLVLFMIPVLISNIINQIYSLMDSIVIGQFLGAGALAAVGTTGPIVFLVIGFAQGISTGLGLKVTQNIGDGDIKKIKRSIATSILISLVLSVVLTAIGMITAPYLLKSMNVPSHIFNDSYAYIMVVYAGIVSSVFSTLLVAILQGFGNSRVPLLIVVVTSIANVILDLVLIGVFKMPIFVSGLTNVAAQSLAAILCFVYFSKVYKEYHLEKADFNINSKDVKTHLFMGLPMAFQFSITAIGVMIVQSLLNLLGESAISGFSIGYKIEQLVTQPMIALGIAASTFSAQNFGAKQYHRIKRGIHISLLISMATTLIAVLCSTLLSGPLIHLFLAEPSNEITQYAKDYLKTISWFYLALNLLFIFRSSLQAIGEQIVPTLGGMMELLGRVVSAFVLVPSIGYLGLAIASPIAWMFAIIILIPRFYIYVNNRKNEIPSI